MEYAIQSRIDPFLWQGWVGKYNATVRSRRERRYRKFANWCVAVVLVEIITALIWVMCNG